MPVREDEDRLVPSNGDRNTARHYASASTTYRQELLGYGTVKD